MSHPRAPGPLPAPLRPALRQALSLLLLVLLPFMPAPAQGQGTAPTDWRLFAAQHGLPPSPASPMIQLVRGDYPHLTINGQARHLIGWDVGGNLSQSRRELLQQIETARDLELPLVILRVDLPSIAASRQQNDLQKIRDLVNAADNLQRWFMLAIELDWAPEWYVRQGRASVMETSTANRREDRALGLGGHLSGAVREPGQGAMIAPGDIHYLDLCKAFLADLHNEFRHHPRFIGWVLAPPSAPLLYPGLGRGGAAGVADYSPVTVGRFDPAVPYWKLMEEREENLGRRDVIAGGGDFAGVGPVVPLELMPEADRAADPEDTATPDLLPDLPAMDPAGEPEPAASYLPRPAGYGSSNGAHPAAQQPFPLTDGGGGGPPEPLPPGSKTGADDRALWRNWTHFRVYELQQRLDILSQKLRSLDQQHPILVTAWGALAYRDHNGYEPMAWGCDPVWLARHPSIDGLIIPFALSSRSFGLPSGIGDSDNFHALRNLTRLAQRYQKLAIVSVEKHPTAPPRLSDLAALQQWCAASGVDPWWSSNGFFTRQSVWNMQERQEIARGVPYGALPFPKRRFPSPVTILDSPLLLSSAYTDMTPRLGRSVHLCDILTAAGVDHDLRFPQEYPASGGARPGLGEVTYLLQRELTIAFDPYTIGFQTLAGNLMRQRGLSDPPVLALDDTQMNVWLLNGFASRPLRDNFMKEIGRFGIRTRVRNGPPSLFEINDTYVFYRALRSGPGRAPELYLLEVQDPTIVSPIASLDFINLAASQPLSLKLTNGFGDFSLLPNSPGEGPVLLGRPGPLGPARAVFAQERRKIIHQQQYATMRANLPWILLLSLSTIALGILFLYQLNVSRKGGLRLYLLRRRQAAIWTALEKERVAMGRAEGEQ